LEAGVEMSHTFTHTEATYTGFEIRRLVAWASQECAWQLTGPLEVDGLVAAYFYLRDQDRLTGDVLRRMANMIQPDKNPDPDRYREVNVRVGISLKPKWENVPRLMEIWLDADDEREGGVTELFREFEEIHPFADGNGRVGALLFNWWGGTYAPMDLQYPPNLWNDSRREGVEL
jgi:hypothetical protein